MEKNSSKSSDQQDYSEPWWPVLVMEPIHECTIVLIACYVRLPSTHQESSSNPTTTAATTQMSSTLYKLMHLTKKAHCVAYGRLMGESPEDEGCYRVIIDEIFDGEVELQDGVSNLRDKILGDFIDWPKYRTFPC